MYDVSTYSCIDICVITLEDRDSSDIRNVCNTANKDAITQIKAASSLCITANTPRFNWTYAALQLCKKVIFNICWNPSGAHVPGF
jgi:hypothetical protein